MYKTIIVDDDAWARADMRMIAEDCGLDIAGEFFCAEDALVYLFANPVDIVITDICMPGQSGLNLIRMARQNNLNYIYIVITGHEDFKYVQEAFKNHVFYYLLKPIKDDEMREVIARACAFLQSAGAPNAAPREEGDGIYQSVITYVREHYAENFTLNELAERFYVNPSYLSNLFVKRGGVNFSNYRNSLRIQRAKELIAGSDRTMLDIAVSVGFESSSYFCRVFKEVVGMAPQQYRKRVTYR